MCCSLPLSEHLMRKRTQKQRYCFFLLMPMSIAKAYYLRFRPATPYTHTCMTISPQLRPSSRYQHPHENLFLHCAQK